MPDDAGPPTPYPEVNATLAALLAGVQASLGPRLVGLYLYGSLASGDFDPASSDVDFVVVTTGAPLPGEIVAALEAMHARLAASGLKWAPKLEGMYITQTALRRYDPADGPFPTVNEGAFYLAHQDSPWVLQRQVLREHGVVVAGPPPAALIDPVPPAALRQAILEFLREWWAPMLANPARLQTPVYQAYAVLTLCRAMHTLSTGRLASKPAAARWALSALDERWRPLIHWALAPRAAAEASRLDAVLSFIRHALERSRDPAPPGA